MADPPWLSWLDQIRFDRRHRFVEKFAEVPHGRPGNPIDARPNGFWADCSFAGRSAHPARRAQTQKPAQGEKAKAESKKDRSSEAGKAAKRGASSSGRAAQPPERRGEPSAAYQESVRQTVERRRERRARRQQNAGNAALAPGAIVPWPMPPALIIRHTREVHGEVDSLLYGLRR